jgi:hypothetical protein
MNEKMQSSLAIALRKSYGWKPPVQQTKGGDVSLALYLVAAAFFLLRLLWGLQAAKMLLRWIQGPERDIPPWLGEAYIFGSVALESCFCTVLLVTHWQMPRLRWLACLLLWKAAETVSSNLYYLLLRPVLELKSPHNRYRNFILAAAGGVEVWLLLSLVWLASGAAMPDLNHSLASALMLTGSFFGFGTLLLSVGESSLVLSIISALALKLMTFLLLVSAIQLVCAGRDMENQ